MPTVQTTAAAAPWNKRPAIQRAMCVPMHSKAVAAPSATKPSRRGHLRDSARSAMYPMMARDVSKQQLCSETWTTHEKRLRARLNTVLEEWMSKFGLEVDSISLYSRIREAQLTLVFVKPNLAF